MDLWEALRARHSVRRYTEKPIAEQDVLTLQDEVNACNAESGLHIQLVTEEPEAFKGFLARYGSFRGVRNYFALVGKQSDRLDELAGYYGERLVLKAQTLSLNTCWVGLSYSKRKAHIQVAEGERLVCVIALGYGENQGSPHKDHPLATRCSAPKDAPDWFRRGMEAVMLAPTAINQQKFRFTYENGTVKAEATGGPYCNVDFGIVKYHFVIGAGGGHWEGNRFAKER